MCQIDHNTLGHPAHFRRGARACREDEPRGRALALVHPLRMPIALLARPPQLLNTCGAHPPPLPSRDVARHSRTLTPHHPLSPNQADDNPMGDIGKKISDFFSGLMPKEEEPPMCARWSERWTPVAAVAPGGSPPGAPLRHPCRSTSAPGGAEHGIEAPRAYGSIAHRLDHHRPEAPPSHPPSPTPPLGSRVAAM